jgi:FKBP-type peptidyl-prolyl cis-trans isomerase 2
VSYNENVINQLGDGDPRLMGLIHGLQSVKAGEKRRFTVPASRAYGPYDPRLSIKVNLKNKKIPLGKQFHIGSQITYPHKLKMIDFETKMLFNMLILS